MGKLSATGETAYTSEAHEFITGALWCSCCSIFSFLCNVLHIIVCPYSFGIILCVLRFTTRFPIWYLQYFLKSQNN